MHSFALAGEIGNKWQQQLLAPTVVGDALCWIGRGRNEILVPHRVRREKSAYATRNAIVVIFNGAS